MIFRNLSPVVTAVAALGALWATPALGQSTNSEQKTAKTQTEPPKMFDDWALRCSTNENKTRVCSLNQLIIDKESKRQVLRLTVVHNKKDNTDGLVVVAPLGVALQKGLAFASSSMPAATFPYRFCLRDGCYLEFPVSANLLADMKKGGQGEVSFTPAGAQKPISLKISFKGFEDGYDALVAAK